jgi:MFS family permease
MATYQESEKANSVYVEEVDRDSASDYDARINVFTEKEQKAIIWRIDRRLVLTLGFMYCASLMDRTNLGIAVVAGMGYDLMLSLGARYSIITLVFFFTYVFLQPPATVILRKVGPKWFLPSTCLAWGILTVGFGFVHQWWEMIPLRLVLGVLEAGFFPGEYCRFRIMLTLTSQAVLTCYRAGIQDTSSRSAMLSSS